jgi:hypothetical protein
VPVVAAILHTELGHLGRDGYKVRLAAVDDGFVLLYALLKIVNIVRHIQTLF